MPYTLAQFRAATRGLKGTLKLQGIDEGSGLGADVERPWQAYKVRAVDVDQEQNPTAVEILIAPLPNQHG